VAENLGNDLETEEEIIYSPRHGANLATAITAFLVIHYSTSYESANIPFQEKKEL
jgi:hypothetical protein